MIFRCEGSSGRARVVERSSARARSRSQARGIRKLAARHVVITVHIATEPRGAYSATIDVYKLANML